ncbi:hypothetical protein [Dyadobacter luticola]|uniref:Uncharacterized protein n=1 Tax=Dyadobacter luticola TaxID=1979387 RepID=A0A5R9L5E2_9BACT|nr:hypothetical protein [Dyadobacter luticola]TLV03658.1 hypothetical protein FEN17_08670 [Dyadobacter luticola]
MEENDLNQLHEWGLRVSRLLELIALTNRTLHLHQEEGGSDAQINDYKFLLSQHQSELDDLMRNYGLRVQISSLESAA